MIDGGARVLDNGNVAVGQGGAARVEGQKSLLTATVNPGPLGDSNLLLQVVRPHDGPTFDQESDSGPTRVRLGFTSRGFNVQLVGTCAWRRPFFVFGCLPCGSFSSSLESCPSPKNPEIRTASRAARRRAFYTTPNPKTPQPATPNQDCFMGHASSNLLYDISCIDGGRARIVNEEIDDRRMDYSDEKRVWDGGVATYGAVTYINRRLTPPHQSLISLNLESS